MGSKIWPIAVMLLGLIVGFEASSTTAEADPVDFDSDDLLDEVAEREDPYEDNNEIDYDDGDDDDDDEGNYLDMEDPQRGRPPRPRGRGGKPKQSSRRRDKKPAKRRGLKKKPLRKRGRKPAKRRRRRSGRQPWG